MDFTGIWALCRMVILLLLLQGVPQAVIGIEVDLIPKSVADGPFQLITIDGVTHYQVRDYQGQPARYIYFDVPDTFPITGEPLYVQVFYREYGIGSLQFQYDSNSTEGTELEQKYWLSEESYGKISMNGQGERESVYKLEKPKLSGRQNGGTDCRIGANLGAERLTIKKAILSTIPPLMFTENSAKPWLEPYTGPSRSDIDATTLDGKVLCGYQGWFSTPTDGSETGYRHWSRAPFSLTSATITVDYWPEVSEYNANDLFKVDGMMHPGGQLAYLYSPFRKGPVLRHFQWMRQYGIDGIFLSRFIVSTKYPPHLRHFNMVLNHVREGCHLEGRTWALMYDVSGSWPNMGTADIMNDWKFLCDQVKIRQDSRYLHHGGKPVVLLWGFGFNDRNWTAQQAAETIDWFKNDPTYGGVYLIGGVDPYWRTLGGASRKEPEWAAVYRSFDSISVWNAGRYKTLPALQSFQANVWAPDLAELNTLGKGYMPTVFPGFSWDNLQKLAPGQSKISRLDGLFYWRQFYYQKALGVKSVFVGMFDEMDEGTQIFKVSQSPPVGPYLLTYEGKPSDWYLRLTGTASMMMRGEIPLTDAIPQSLPFPIDTSNSREWNIYD